MLRSISVRWVAEESLDPGERLGRTYTGGPKVPIWWRFRTGLQPRPSSGALGETRLLGEDIVMLVANRLTSGRLSELRQTVAVRSGGMSSVAECGDGLLTGGRGRAPRLIAYSPDAESPRHRDHWRAASVSSPWRRRTQDLEMSYA